MVCGWTKHCVDHEIRRAVASRVCIVAYRTGWQLPAGVLPSVPESKGCRQPWQQVRQTVPAIDSIFEFRQITRCKFRIERARLLLRRMLLKLSSVEFNPVKLRFIHGGAKGTADDCLISVSGSGDGIETFHAVSRIDYMDAGPVQAAPMRLAPVLPLL